MLCEENASSLALTSTWPFVVAVALATSEEICVNSGRPLKKAMFPAASRPAPVAGF